MEDEIPTGTIILNKKGEFVEYVKYYLVEMKTLDGYVLCDDVMEVVFEYVDRTIKYIEYMAEIENVREVTVPELSKTGDRWKWWWDTCLIPITGKKMK